jgi:hypothetical protein
MRCIRFSSENGCDIHLVEFGFGVRRRLGSGFSDSDERIPEGFEEDDHEF